MFGRTNDWRDVIADWRESARQASIEHSKSVMWCKGVHYSLGTMTITTTGIASVLNIWKGIGECSQNFSIGVLAGLGGISAAIQHMLDFGSKANLHDIASNQYQDIVRGIDTFMVTGDVKDPTEVVIFVRSIMEKIGAIDHVSPNPLFFVRASKRERISEITVPKQHSTIFDNIVIDRPSTPVPPSPHPCPQPQSSIPSTITIQEEGPSVHFASASATGLSLPGVKNTESDSRSSSNGEGKDSKHYVYPDYSTGNSIALSPGMGPSQQLKIIQARKNRSSLS